MRETRSTNHMMIVLLILIVGAAIFGVVRLIGFTQALGGNPWQNYKNDLLARAHRGYTSALQQWAAHPIAHYRLDIDRSQPNYPQADKPDCRQSLEVKDETVTKTIEDSCTPGAYADLGAIRWNAPPPALLFEATIMQFFATIDGDTQQIDWIEVGCAFRTLDVTFDSQRGYPTSMLYNIQLPPRSIGFPVDAKYLDPSDGVRNEPGCAAMGYFPGPLVAIHLTPMQ